MLLLTLLVAAPCFVLAWHSSVHGLGDSSRFDVRAIDYDGGNAAPRPTASQRLAWEVRKRTSIEPRLIPTRVRLDHPSIFETPFLYLSGDRAFPPWSAAEVEGLRRFVQFGGLLWIDHAAPDQDVGLAGASRPGDPLGTGGAGTSDGFDASIRRELRRALGREPLVTVPNRHTVFRSFYLVPQAVGRVASELPLLAVMRDQRAAIIYSRHDVGGALARDNLGTYRFSMTPGGESQREMAVRLAVNIVMYSLCLDYKDDQVHVPFILRRIGGSP